MHQHLPQKTAGQRNQLFIKTPHFIKLFTRKRDYHRWMPSGQYYNTPKTQVNAWVLEREVRGRPRDPTTIYCGIRPRLRLQRERDFV